MAKRVSGQLELALRGTRGGILGEIRETPERLT